MLLGAVLDLAQIKRKDFTAQRAFLRKSGIKISKLASKDEIGAALCAYTGKLYQQGKVEFVGDHKEGRIVLPKIAKCDALPALKCGASRSESF